MDAELRRALTALLPRLRRFAVTLVGSPPEADALVRAACEQALRADRAQQPGTRLDGWLYRIMRDLQRARPVPRDLGAAAARSPTASAGFAGNPKLDVVRRGLAALPDEPRTVLLLVCADGFTYKEAAETLDIPLQRVVSHLASARLALMRDVSAEAPETHDS